VTDGGEDVRMEPQALPANRTGILMVRLWIEASAVEGFRARITQTLDSMTTEQAVATVASPEDLYETIRGWVETFVSRN
jgi:hypothetical protein